MSDASAATSHETRRTLARVARGGALGLVGAAVSAVSGFVLVLVVTNRFTPETAGLFFTVTSMFLVLSALATLGCETGLGRFVLRYEALGRHGDIPPTLRVATRPAVAFSVVLAVLLMVVAPSLSRLVGLDGEEGTSSLRVLAALLPFATWNELTLAGSRAFGKMSTTVLVEQVARPLAQPILAWAVSLLGVGLLALTLAWSVPYALAAGASAVLFRRFLVTRGTLTHTEPTTSARALRREFWSFTWPRAITRMAQMGIQRLDIIIIAVMRSPTEAAVYTAATRFVALGQFGTQAIQQVLQPTFTALLADERDTSLRGVFQVATAWSMAIAWPIYLVVACAPVVYLSQFGAPYASDGVPTVVLMSVAMLFAVATGAADTLLLMSGRSTLSLVNTLAALALDVGLCVWLIPHLGITGAAVAWAVANSTRCLLAVLQVRRAHRIVSFGVPAGIVAGAGLGCIALPLLGLSLITTLDVVTLLLAGACCAPLYLGALWLGRRPLMVDVLRDLLGRRTAGSSAFRD